jgi:hypothetical protein
VERAAKHSAPDTPGGSCCSDSLQKPDFILACGRESKPPARLPSRFCVGLHGMYQPGVECVRL